LRDTVAPLNPASSTGNGFTFETYDTGGLRWAIGEALRFFHGDRQLRIDQVSRVMRESVEAFHPNRTVRGYVNIYERLLAVPDHQRWRGLEN
jgi:glycogen synthase